MDGKKELNGYIPLDFDECYEMKFNRTQFKKGLYYGSYLSGIYSGLINAGLESYDAVKILCKILDQRTTETIEKTSNTPPL